ncbi:MAG: hypothetical protein U0414_18115 [Polyangiaceae bacterium]
MSNPLVRQAALFSLILTGLGCTASLHPNGASVASGTTKPKDVADEFEFVVGAPGSSLVAPTPMTHDPIMRTIERSAAPKRDYPTRANMVGVSIDYASIPLTTVTTRPSARFALQKKTITPRCNAGEVPRVHDEWELVGGIAASSILSVDGAPLPPVAALAAHFEDSRADLARLKEPRIDTASWTTIELPVVGPTMRVDTYEASFDSTTMSGAAKRELSVEAAAIVPNEVYVYRSCEENCHLPSGDPARTDRVTLIGPPAVWTGSGGPAREATLYDAHPFTQLSTRVRKGSSATLTLDYLVESANRMRGEGHGAATSANPAQTVSVMLEVVWTDDAPDVTTYRGQYTETTDPSPPYVDEQIDCIPPPDPLWGDAPPM